MATNISDPGSDRSPRIAMAHSLWALQSLPEPPEHYIKKLPHHTFEAIEVGLRPETMDMARRCKDEFGLKVIGQGWAPDFERVKPFVDRAIHLKAWALNMHLGHAYMNAHECADFAAKAHEYAEAQGVVLLVETHRGRITQDLYRVAEWVTFARGVGVNLDVSHWVVAGEGYGGSTELFFKNLHRVLERTCMIHARVGDGQSIQVDIGIDGKSAHCQVFLDVWTAAMRMWRKEAQPGEVFVFEPELGPPHYAQTDLAGKQTSDRWHQSLVMAELGWKCWRDAEHRRTTALFIPPSPLPAKK